MLSKGKISFKLSAALLVLLLSFSQNAFAGCVADPWDASCTEVGFEVLISGKCCSAATAVCMPDPDPAKPGTLSYHDCHPVPGGGAAVIPVPAAGKHVFMAPRNTEAISLVDLFPWLYTNIDPIAQNDLYRGTGNNTGLDVNSPLPTITNPNDVITSNIVGGNLASVSSNAEGAANDPTNIDTEKLNRYKCLKLRYYPDQCKIGGTTFDPLGATVGKALGEDDYFTKSPALLNRLQMDSCTNQMILPMAFNPKFVFNDKLRSHNVNYNETICQPFKMKEVPCYLDRFSNDGSCLEDPGERDGKLYDYRAWGYLRLAWKGVLQNQYTPSGGTGVYYRGVLGVGDPPYLTDTMLATSAGVPAFTGLTFPGVLGLVDNTPAANPASIPGAEKFGDPFAAILPGGSVGPIGAVIAGFSSFTGNLTTINDLISQPYERIWDPTHPYSPRWDFKGMDRSLSLMATVTDPIVEGIGFSTSTSTCVVRCAAVPVDILSFRMLAFFSCMGCRIGVNSSVWWMEAITLMTDMEFDYFGLDAVCWGVDAETAVNDTTTDKVVGEVYMTSTLNDMAIPGFKYSRLSATPGDSVTVSYAGLSWDIPEEISGGCHFWLCMGCFWKSIAHDFVNQDMPGGILAEYSKQPQRSQFDSYWPVCSTKYDVQDASFNQLMCYPCDIISGDLKSMHGVRNCCDDLAHAVAPINTLKIRNTLFNPGLKPTPEGYAFTGYFSNRDSRRMWPDDVDIQQVTKTRADGSTYDTDYVSTHMPYMRWWDTGTAAGGSAGWVGIKDYDPDSDCGGYDTIVGVGTEDWAGDNKTSGTPFYTPTRYASDTATHEAKYCRYGGNGFAPDADTGLPLGGSALTTVATALGWISAINDIQDLMDTDIDISKIGLPPFYQCIRLRTIDTGNYELGPDALTSWDELKMYQMRAIQRGLNCLPQYEKFHKEFSAEEGALTATGGVFHVPTQLNRNFGNNAFVDPSKGSFNVQFKGALPDAGGVFLTTQDASGKDVPGKFYPDLPGSGFELRTVRWPLNWRGYNTDFTDCNNAFPQFSGDGGNAFITLVTAPPPGFEDFTIPCASSLEALFSDTLGNTWLIPGLLSPLGNVIGPVWGAANYPDSEKLANVIGWPMLPGGLDKAQPGDIVYLTYEDINYALAQGYINWVFGNSPTFLAPMPYVGVVKAVHNSWLGKDNQPHAPVATTADCPADEPNCFTDCERSVVIEDVNNGKFPDVCGNTDAYGFGQARHIYKELLPIKVLNYMFPSGSLVSDNCGHSYTTSTPPGIDAMVLSGANEDVDTTFWGLDNNNYGSCADPKMQACTYADVGLGATNPNSINLWNHFRIYRPTYDQRQ